MTNKCFFCMNVHVPCQMTLLVEIWSTYLATVHPCCRRPLCGSFHGGMRPPIASSQYLVKDEFISWQGCQVGRRVHWQLVVGKGSVQQRQPNVSIHNKATRFHCVFLKGAIDAPVCHHMLSVKSDIFFELWHFLTFFISQWTTQWVNVQYHCGSLVPIWHGFCA